MKKMIFLFILLLSISLINVNSAQIEKIQKNDKWQYKDKQDKKYNETADEIFIRVKGESIQLVSINTTRPYPFLLTQDFIHDGYNISYQLNESSGNIYATQTGLIPMYHNRSYTGDVTINNVTIKIKNLKPEWSVNGDPAKSIVTTQATIFNSMFFFTIDNWHFTFNHRYIISSTISENNYTIQLEALTFYARDDMGDPDNADNDLVIFIDFLDNDSLSLNQFSQFTYEFSLDENYKMPVYIKQTEPVKTTPSLRLSSDNQYNEMEYFLVKDEEISSSSETTTTETIISTETITISEKSDSSLLFLPVIFALIIRKKYR